MCIRGSFNVEEMPQKEWENLMSIARELAEKEIKELCLKAVEFYIIGDCNQVAKIKDAVAEGERVGRWV